MTIAITHPFVSAKGDGSDATLVRPSNWNAAHATSMATGAVIGRQTAGVGAFEELTLTAYMAAALASTDAPSLLAALGIGGFETGDVKFSIQPSAAAGWIVYNGAGTIGDGSSGATIRANADCSALYQLIWNQISDTFCPVTGGRGANAAADFAAHKPIALPQFSGKTIIGAGTGTGLTARTLGDNTVGAETVALTLLQVPGGLTSRNATQSITVTTVSGGNLFGTMPGSARAYQSGSSNFNDTNSVSISGTNDINVTSNNTGAAGNGTGVAAGHSNVQPSIPMWAKVKL